MSVVNIARTFNILYYILNPCGNATTTRDAMNNDISGGFEYINTAGGPANTVCSVARLNTIWPYCCDCDCGRPSQIRFQKHDAPKENRDALGHPNLGEASRRNTHSALVCAFAYMYECLDRPPRSRATRRAQHTYAQTSSLQMWVNVLVLCFGLRTQWNSRRWSLCYGHLLFVDSTRSVYALLHCSSALFGEHSIWNRIRMCKPNKPAYSRTCASGNCRENRSTTLNAAALPPSIRHV